MKVGGALNRKMGVGVGYVQKMGGATNRKKWEETKRENENLSD